MKLKTIIPLISLVVAASDMATAQFDSLSYSVNGKAFLYSNNASYLNRLNINTISAAIISVSLADNGFRNYYNADKSIDAGAMVESFYRFNDKVSAYGRISYNNFYGKQMAGSAFIEPDFAPFDIVEQADTNLGVKNLETYKILGGVGAQISGGLSVGAKVDYTAANYAKRKDLRHKNSLMDLKLTAGLSYDFGILTVGADYLYRRRNEGLKFSTYGTADRTYNSIISYGAFWGLREEFGAEGFTDKSREMPLFDQFNGADIQLLVKITDNLHIFNNFTYQSRDGRYGRKGQYTIEYEQHEGDMSGVDGTVFYTTQRFTHCINYSLSTTSLDAYKNVYTLENLDGGLTNYIYHDRLKMSQKQSKKLNVGYNGLFFSNLKDARQVWDFGVDATFSRRTLMGVRYPYWRRQDLKIKQLAISLGEKNILPDAKELSVKISTFFQKGSGHPYIENYYVKPDLSQQPPSESQVFLYQEYEFLCKPHFAMSLNVKLAKKMFSDKVKSFLSADYTFTKAKNTVYLDGFANEVVINFWVEF